MNPLSKILRHRKAKSGQTPTPEVQPTSEVPRALEEGELNLVGGGAGSGTSSTPVTESPRGGWGPQPESPRGGWGPQT